MIGSDRDDHIRTRGGNLFANFDEGEVESIIRFARHHLRAQHDHRGMARCENAGSRGRARTRDDCFPIANAEIHLPPPQRFGHIEPGATARQVGPSRATMRNEATCSRRAGQIARVTGMMSEAAGSFLLR